MTGEIISERRATSNRNGERDHRGFASDFPRMLFGVLIADGERVYDPWTYHDRLLLGLSGTMSECGGS
jgi:hypothetical protein